MRILRLAVLLLALAGTAWAAPDAATFPRYDLEVTIDPAARRLAGAGTVRLPATASDRETVALALGELFGELSVEVVAPAASAGPATTTSVVRPWGRPAWGTRVWTVRPPRPVPAGEPVVLKVAYSGGGEQTGFGFALAPESCFGIGLMTAWYPELEDEPKERLRGVRATGSLRFVVPAGFQVHANGARRSTDGEAARGVFRFEVERPSFFSFGAGRYTISRRAGPVPVSLFLLETRSHTRDYLDGCARVIDVLAREFGPYPHTEFALVELPTAQADAAGFAGANADGFVFANSDFLDRDFNVAYYGHEVGHQWWGGTVFRKGPKGIYILDEALAQYGSLRTVEALEGAAAAERYRRTGYPGFFLEYSGRMYLLRSAAGLDHRLDDLPASDNYLCMRMADSKGMLVFDMLSRAIGRDRFRRAMHEVTRKYAYGRVSWEEFLGEVSAAAGRDMGWFYEQWFSRTGAPEWSLEWRQEGGTVRGAIVQAAPFYRATLEVVASGGGRRVVRAVEVAGARTELAWPVGFRVETVEIDPRFETLRWTPEYRAEAEALLPFTRADLQYSRGETAEAEATFRAAIAAAPAVDPHGLRFLLEHGLAQLLLDARKWEEARSHATAALASPSPRAEVLPWVHLQLATAAKHLGDAEGLRRAVAAVERADDAAGGRTGAVEQARALLK
jgi:hypothetical protein